MSPAFKDLNLIIHGERKDKVTITSQEQLYEQEQATIISLLESCGEAKRWSDTIASFYEKFYLDSEESEEKTKYPFFNIRTDPSDEKTLTLDCLCYIPLTENIRFENSETDLFMHNLSSPEHIFRIMRSRCQEKNTPYCALQYMVDENLCLNEGLAMIVSVNVSRDENSKAYDSLITLYGISDALD